MIQRAHNAGQRLCRLIQPQDTARLGALGQAEIAALAQVLRAARGQARLQLLHQRGEAFDPGGIACGVERKGCVLRRNLNRMLDEDVPLIHPAVDQVPGYGVPGFARQKRPDRRVQPGVARQRAVMEIHCALGRQGQQIIVQNVEIGDAKQPVAGQAGQLRARRLDPQPRLARPIGQHRVAGDKGSNPMPPVQPLLRAFAGEAFIADDEGAELGHKGLRCGCETGWAQDLRAKSARRSWLIRSRRKCSGSTRGLRWTRARSR